MERKKRRAQEERKTLNKTQEVLYGKEFRAADRAMRSSNQDV